MAVKNTKPARKSLPGPDDIFRTELENGITILARTNFDSPSISMAGYLPAGAIFESDEKLGLADFVSSALMRGTQRHSFDGLYNELETAGASMGFDSGVHNASFGGRALVEDMPLLLDLLAESLRTPVFPPEEIEKLRAQLLTGLVIRAQDTMDAASMAFDRMLFGEHPYGRPSDGYAETVQAITRNDLEDFHRLHYGPKGMVIAVVGAVEPERSAAEVERVLGSWKNPLQTEAPPLPAVRPVKKNCHQHQSLSGKSQSDLVLGMLGPSRKDPEFLAASIGNSILGQFGMMGRIGEVVRERAGLAYYASSSLNSGIGPGSWEITAGVNPKNLKKAIALIESELKRFIQTGVTKTELADSQANYIGRLPLSLESNGGVASAMINLERYQLGMDYYLSYEERVKRVSRGDILEVARKYIDPGRLVISTAGP